MTEPKATTPLTEESTPQQVLAAGGVSKRRRPASSTGDGKRRSPSSHRRRAATPPPPPRSASPEHENGAENEPPPERKVATMTTTTKTTRRVVRDKNISKRSLSSPSENRQTITSLELKTVSADGKIEAEVKKTSPKKVKTTKPEVADAKPEDAVAKPVEPVPKEEVADAKPEVVTSTDVALTDGGASEEVKSTPELEGVEKEGNLQTEVIAPAAPTWRPFLKDTLTQWRSFKRDYVYEYQKIVSQRNRCVAALVIVLIYCGLGGLIFRFTEGAFESFYKCGVKRVKRDFVDSLWLGSHHLLEDEWKSQARRKLMEFEDQLHAAHEAGVQSYSGQRSWSFLNAVVYCLTVVTTIGYGHISPSTTTGRAITIVYAIFGIPMFLILLADFGKLFTRGIKFLWAFVRRVYYTGSCKKVRRTARVQEVMKGVQLVYDFATFRRPSQMMEKDADDADVGAPLDPNQMQPPPQQAHLSLDGLEQPGTPVPTTFEVDDEFNLPISVAIVILLIYIFVGASIYWMWETWGFFESFYFVFISMSTIGFGDFVPQHPMYMMASIVYLVFGLALTSMCINVVQEKLSDSFRQASAKIGATIGLRVAEEDGTMTPVLTVPAEMPELQAGVVTKSQST